MKIAVSAEGPDLGARAGNRFGTSAYLIIVDSQNMSFDAVSNPGAAGQRAAGIQAVVLAISKKVDAVLTGFCSPTAMKYLSENGIEVITGVKGTVAEVVTQYREQVVPISMRSKNKVGLHKTEIDKASLINAFRNSGKQLIYLLPVFVGVILLVGLFNAFISKELLSSIFSGNTILDTFAGAGLGSITAGNPINSYVIGGELIGYGVSLFAVTAFMTTWVTVGLVQLPAEMAALGKKFALTRNALSFILSMAVSLLTVITYNFVVG